MISNKKAAAYSQAAAKVVGGKMARACDSCIKKGARWYCAADDAFLCQACDSSVHSANQLASRHERVLLKTASSSHKLCSNSGNSNSSEVPSWLGGFTRKARTPRGYGKATPPRTPFPVVPEVGEDDVSYEESNEEEQLLYRVPIFDPLVTELCTSSHSNTVSSGNESKSVSLPSYYLDVGNGNSSSNGFDLPSDMDLAEFAADVDSLLGRGIDDDECFGIEGLGLMDCNEKGSITTEEGSSGKVKLEDDDDDAFMACQAETEIDLMREPFVLNFEDYDDSSPPSCAEDEEVDEDDKLRVRINHDGMERSGSEKHNNCKKRKIFLRLDYDAVKTTWDSQSKESPWTLGNRPDFDCLRDCMGTSSGAEILHYPCGDLSGVIGLQTAMTDGGREARVSRYREKRRTRLFSKKIRYEVRKLNAEKRPRIKGRFVKRTSFAASGSTFPMLTN